MTIIPENFARPLASVKPIGRTTGAPTTPFGQKPTENNPLTMTMLNEYRMQLWARMAQQTRQQLQEHQPFSLSPFVQQPYAPITGRAPVNPSLKKTLSPRYLVFLFALVFLPGANPTPPISPKASSASLPSHKDVDPQHALLAVMASQTLLQKLGSKFLDAFSGSGSGVGCVCVQAIASSTSTSTTPSCPRAPHRRACAHACNQEFSLSAALEENMRALTLGRKWCRRRRREEGTET
ncbi:hypothetical protein OF83DRAFT_1171849 [Amylostereum chailletii]|nr:hypothetical protein OF83DRAFT_1171849 [Amylostereum chailletii]